MLCLIHESIHSGNSSKIDGERGGKKVEIKSVGTLTMETFSRFTTWKRRSSQKTKSMAAVFRFNIRCINISIRRKQLTFKVLPARKQTLYSFGKWEINENLQAAVPEFT